MPATYGAHGHFFTVEAPEPVASRVGEVLHTLERTESVPVGRYRITPADGGWTLGWEDDEVGVRRDVDSLLLLLHWHVNQATIAASAAKRTTLHAAAARSPAGRGVLLPAPMESGKTTTVTGLLRAGWAFLSDEAVALDPDGTMWAYPKPLTIDSGSWALFPELRPDNVAPEAESWLVPAVRTGGLVASKAPLALIVFPAYTAGGSTGVEPLSASAAALELAYSTFHFEQHGARDLRCLSGVARRVPAYRLTIGDLDRAVGLLQELETTLAGTS